jgi:ElaB/YqjD/DUF883 family membrane-anchored ribosome-binding protein
MADTATATAGPTGQAQEKASELAGQAKEQAQQATQQARTQVRDQVDQRSTQAGELVSSQASDVRSVAEQLRQQGKDKPAQLAEQAADRAERVGSYLTEADADRILNDVEDFARQRPWAVIAGGVAAGFLASRFLKASSSDRYRGRTYSQQPSQLPNTTTRPAGTTPMPTAGNELSSGVGVGTQGTGVPIPAATDTERSRFGRD